MRQEANMSNNMWRCRDAEAALHDYIFHGNGAAAFRAIRSLTATFYLTYYRGSNPEDRTAIHCNVKSFSA